MSTGGASTYRDVLAVPGVRALSVVTFAARLPLTAAGVLLTLHVAVTLGRGFAAAGLVGAAITVGIAVGAPLLGALVDRVGLRRTLIVSAVADAAFWTVAPWLDVAPLAACAFVAGLLSLPAFSVTRQALAVAVPADRRRPAFALDAMSAELSFIVGPAVGTAIALGLPAAVSMRLIGAGFVLMAGVLGALNPPTRHAAGPEDTGSAPGPARRSRWLSRPMIGAMAAATAAVALLGSTELGVVAALTARGETGYWAVANTVWCLSSLAGGWVYGVTARSPSGRALLAALAVASAPVALGGPWWVAALLLVPAGACCAPALAASAETVGRLAPDSVRGLATGLHGSAITLGQAVAAPTAGLLIDGVGPPAAILAAAGAALLVAVASGSARPRRDRQDAQRSGAGPSTQDAQRSGAGP